MFLLQRNLVSGSYIGYGQPKQPFINITPLWDSKSSILTIIQRFLFLFSNFKFINYLNQKMKRERNQEIYHHQSIAMANCLMLLSEVTTNYTSPSSSSYSSSPTLGRVFECKTCNRQFSSFQALGGHRASHKKPRTTVIVNMDEEAKDNNNNNNNNNDVLILHGSSSSLPSNKPRTHECSICGLEFALGQALGGHMRRHRVSSTSTCSKNNDNNSNENLKIHCSTSMSMSNNNVESSDSEEETKKKKKKKKQDYLLMDLNLTPWENDLEILRIKKATLITPLVDCFYWISIILAKKNLWINFCFCSFTLW